MWTRQLITSLSITRVIPVIERQTPVACVWLSLLTLCTIGPVATACAEEPGPIEPAMVTLNRPVDFDRDIAPILEAKCIACHNVSLKESGLNLESVAHILEGGDRGPAVVAKDPANSVLYTMAARTYDPAMPPLPNKVSAVPVTPEELGLIRLWIEQGAVAGQGAVRQELAWRSLPDSLSSIYSVAISNDNRFVAAGRANQLDLYDTVRGAFVGRLVDPALSTVPGPTGLLYPQGAAHRDLVHAVAFHPSGRLLASAGYREVKLWERAAPAERHTIPVGQAMISTVVSPDGQWLAAITADQQVRLWSTAGSTEGRILPGVSGTLAGLTFSPDSTRVFVGSSEKLIYGWNTAGADPFAQLAVTQPVTSLVVLKEGTRLAAGQADNLIRLYPMPASGAVADIAAPTMPEKELPGHGGPVTALGTIATDPNRIISGSADGSWKIWDLSNGNAVTSVGFAGTITFVSVRDDGQFVVAAGGDQARLWKIDGNQVAELKGRLLVDRQVQELVDQDTVAKARQAIADAAFKEAEKSHQERVDQTTKATEAKTKAEQAVADAVAKEQPALQAFEAAGAASDAQPADEGLKAKKTELEQAWMKEAEAVKQARMMFDQAVKAVTQAERAQMTSLETQQAARLKLDAAIAVVTAAEAALVAGRQAQSTPEAAVQSAVFTAHGTQVATQTADGVIRLWDATTGKAIDEFGTSAAPQRLLGAGPGDWLITSRPDLSLQIWPCHPGWELVGRLGVTPENPLETTASPMVDRVLCMAFSPDGQWLATGGGEPSRGGELLIWNVSLKQFAAAIPEAHSDTIFGLDFSRDGTQLASCGADKFVRVFDVASRKLVRSFEGHTHHVLDVSWKSDGHWLASAGADNSIKIWNLATGEQQRTIQNHSRQVTSVQYIGISDNIISGSGDQSIKSHRSNDGGHYRTFGGMPDYIHTVAATRDESLVVAGGADGVLRIWNGQSGQELFKFDPPPVVSQPQANAR